MKVTLQQRSSDLFSILYAIRVKYCQKIAFQYHLGVIKGINTKKKGGQNFDLIIIECC